MTVSATSDLFREINNRIWQHYIPKELPKMEDWVRENITIDVRQSSEHAGRPMDIAMTPHARIIYDFLEDERAEELNLIKSSAASMTSTLIAACFYRLKFKPGNLLYLIGNVNEAKKMSVRFFQPWMRQVFGDVVANEETQAALHLKVNGIDLLLGSPTEKLLRGMQVSCIIEDESDSLPDFLDGGGQSLEAAERERVKGTRRAKIIRLSSPLRKWNPKTPPNIVQPHARIDRLYHTGDQRVYRCPCPACGVYQEIKYDDLVTRGGDYTDKELDVERILSDTFWRCQLCKAEVHEGTEKMAMVRAGRWEPTKQTSGRIWSAKHTDLCALIGRATWGRIRAEIEGRRGTIEEAGVRRAYLAEPEDTTSYAVHSRDHGTILRHCGDYDRGTCPIVPWRVVAYYDVQKNCERFPFVVSALAKDGTVYVLDWGEAGEFSEIFTRDRTNGKIYGLFTNPIPLRISEATARFHFKDKDAPEFVYITRALIDSGYSAKGANNQDNSAEESVYGFCASTFDVSEMRYLISPAKGRAGRQILVPTIDSSVDYNGRTLPLHLYDDWSFKRDLYNIRLASDPAAPSPLAKDRPRIYFPKRQDLEADHAESDTGQSFLSQILSERIVDGPYRTSSGAKKHGPHWESSGPNDLGDCVKGCLILYAILSKHLMTQIE